MSKLIKAALVTVAMASSSVFAASQASDMGNYYFGVGVTQNATTTTDSGARGNVTFSANGTTNNYQAKNDHNLGYTLLGGYKVNNSWAGEVSWKHNGKVEFEKTDLSATAKFKSDLFDLSAVYSMNLASSLYGFAKVGVAFYQTKFETDTSSQMNGFAGTYGLGLGTNFTQNMGLRAEWTGFQANDNNVVKQVMPNTVGLTFLYQFA